jgi:hypothetical protein
MYDLKNIETHESRNGYSMKATLLINNIEVCTMRDEGDGSMPAFDIHDPKAYNKIIADLEKLPVAFVTEYDSEVKIDLCIFIDLLNYALETKTEFKLLAA